MVEMISCDPLGESQRITTTSRQGRGAGTEKQDLRSQATRRRQSCSCAAELRHLRVDPSLALTEESGQCCWDKLP